MSVQHGEGVGGDLGVVGEVLQKETTGKTAGNAHLKQSGKKRGQTECLASSLLVSTLKMSWRETWRNVSNHSDQPISPAAQRCLSIDSLMIYS